jgi:hypothetical protein
LQGDLVLIRRIPRDSRHEQVEVLELSDGEKKGARQRRKGVGQPERFTVRVPSDAVGGCYQSAYDAERPEGKERSDEGDFLDGHPARVPDGAAADEVVIVGDGEGVVRGPGPWSGRDDGRGRGGAPRMGVR